MMSIPKGYFTHNSQVRLRQQSRTIKCVSVNSEPQLMPLIGPSAVPRLPPT